MVKVAITLPDDVFQAAEKMRLEGNAKLTRSEFFRAAVEEYVGRRTSKKESLEELKAFFDSETEDNLNEWVYQASMKTLAEVPWDEELEGEEPKQ